MQCKIVVWIRICRGIEFCSKRFMYDDLQVTVLVILHGEQNVHIYRICILKFR